MMHVYSNFKSCTGTLEDKKYLQVSLDGPNVNLPFFDILDEATIIFIIFWDSLMFYQIFLSPQAKRCAFTSYKHVIYELPHELRNDLRLEILGNEEILGKCPSFIE